MNGVNQIDVSMMFDHKQQTKFTPQLTPEIWLTYHHPVMITGSPGVPDHPHVKWLNKFVPSMNVLTYAKTLSSCFD